MSLGPAPHSPKNLIFGSALHSLQGALGKTSGRSYKAAPRQLLQVDSNGSSTSPSLAHAHAHISKQDSTDETIKPLMEGAAAEAAKLGREALGNAADVSSVLVVVKFVITNSS